MRRRDLFGRLATIAAAVAVAPSAQVEAASQQPGHHIPDEEMARRRAIWARGRCSYTTDCPCGDALPSWTRDPEVVKAVLMANTSEARAEGYERGRAVAEARAESRALEGLT